MNIIALAVAIMFSGLWMPTWGTPVLPAQQTAQACPRHPDLIDDLEAVVETDESVFDDADWSFVLNYDETASKIKASWTNNPSGAVAYSEVLFYNCGYEDKQIEDYHDFDVIWENYDSWEETDSCEQDDLELHEFAMVDDNRDYLVRYWIQRASKTRVINIHVVFLKKDSRQLDEYSEALFPDFASCERE